MRKPIEEILMDALSIALEGLHEAHLRTTGGGLERANDVAGIIGFGGHFLRGSLVLMTNLAAAAKSQGALYPHLAPDQLMVRDWVAELTNQALGRIMNRLVERGLSFEPSTPVVVWGSNFESEAYRGPTDDARTFEAHRSPVTVRWNVSLSEAAERVILAPPLVAATAAEGELILF